tara:strand:- start:1885 stop:3171 length:1287 start_codon:yes stop_codon:yes gene_type:complete
MALDPNISLGVRPLQLEMPNQLAQYAQLSQIQNAQNQNRMAEMQLQEYERARGEEEGLRNYLTSTDFTKPENRAGLLKFGKTGREYVKTLTEQDAAALTAKNVQSQISERDYGVQDKKLKFAWNAVGSASTPQAAIAELTKGVKDGVFDMKSATTEIQQIQNMTPEQYQQYRVQKIMGILDAKDKLGFMLPKTRDRDIGGVIQTIQDNPALPGYSQPIAGGAISKTMTPGEAAANARARELLAQNATGVVYQEDNQGNVIALPSKLKQGEVPVARVAVAPGGGFQPLMGKPSESVAKEQISINQQRAIVKGAIDAVTKTPDAFGMTRGLMGETLGGRMGSSEENEARSYLFNVVSGVIKERAGTAQSASEAETLARFLPQPTDDADVIKDKMTAFDKYLVAKESGTTKKRGGASTPDALGTGTWKVVR